MGQKIKGLEIKSVAGVEFEYLPVKRGNYRGLCFLFLDDIREVTEEQSDAIDELRREGFAVGKFADVNDALRAMNDYFKGREP